MTTSISVKRIYQPADPSDGTRLLIDGLWPRGIGRDEIPEDTWIRDVAPSSDLRSWYRHDPERFEEFTARYRQELDLNPAVDKILRHTGHVTLLTATRDIDLSHAVVLRDYLVERIGDEV